MKVVLIGKRFATGTSKKNNKPYQGFFLSYTYPAQGYEGVRCSEKFVSVEALQGIVPDIGDKLDIDFNETGYIVGVTIVEPVANARNLNGSQGTNTGK